MHIPRCRLRNGSLPRGQVDAVLMKPVLSDHWAVESNEACDVVKVGQKRSDVAVADENLGMRPDLFEIQRVQEIVGTVTTAGAEDRADVVADKHFFQLARPALHRAGKVKIVFQDRIEIERAVACALQCLTAGFQVSSLHITGGRDNADSISRAKGWRSDGLKIG